MVDPREHRQVVTLRCGCDAGPRLDVLPVPDRETWGPVAQKVGGQLIPGGVVATGGKLVGLNRARVSRREGVPYEYDCGKCGAHFVWLAATLMGAIDRAVAAGRSEIVTGIDV